MGNESENHSCWVNQLKLLQGIKLLINCALYVLQQAVYALLGRKIQQFSNQILM